MEGSSFYDRLRKRRKVPVCRARLLVGRQQVTYKILLSEQVLFNRTSKFLNCLGFPCRFFSRLYMHINIYKENCRLGITFYSRSFLNSKPDWRKTQLNTIWFRTQYEREKIFDWTRIFVIKKLQFKFVLFDRSRSLMLYL